MLKQWETFIQKQRGEDWHASRWSSLCSRHFREEDFRSLNERRTLKKSAVPSLLGDELPIKDSVNYNTRKRKTYEKVVEPYETTRDKEFKEILAIKERLEDGVANGGVLAPNVPKSNCRLCGIASIPVVDFLNSYEVYGLLQKCFPTLNIQQEDALPKVLCATCHKNLEQFGSFVDRVSAAQSELQRKFRSKAIEKPVKIKQEPLVRVKQEVAESGYEENQDTNGLGCSHEEYDGVIDGGVHEEGDDQKYEFCDFPIINDCDIMEIINLDDPFINIPDDDNPSTANDEDEILQKPMQESVINNYMPSAHELLQSHLLMEEHNYAYIDAEAEFKEERQIYKTEKPENDERLADSDPLNYQAQHQQKQQQQQQPVEHNQLQQHLNMNNNVNNSLDSYPSKPAGFERRALKPIVTSVSAIQQPTKSSSNGIVVLNESIVKSGCGFQLHACMVCQLKFFSVESLKQHYTQTHGTPMVTVPGCNILLEKLSESTCKMEKEFSDNVDASKNLTQSINNNKRLEESPQDKVLKERPSNIRETKREQPEDFVDQGEISKNKPVVVSKNSFKKHDSERKKENENKITVANKLRKTIRKVPLKYRRPQNVSLNTMANQYQQLRKLYQKLQKKCSNLEQNVEQLQSMPKTKRSAGANAKNSSVKKPVSDTKKAKMLTSTVTNIEEQKSLKDLDFKCPECFKNFSNANSLRQHKITHTDERKHLCSLCHRCFKRRNGLLQHLKGFHLNVKPFTCVVCSHSYALKCDMLRCKHSTLRSLQAIK